MVKLLENLLQSCLILNSEQRFTPEQVNSTHSSLFGHNSLFGDSTIARLRDNCASATACYRGKSTDAIKKSGTDLHSGLINQLISM